MKVVAVVGTGTGIGKTHVGARLLRAAGVRGLRCAGRKPIESGVVAGDPGSDAGLLESAGNVAATEPPPYVFPDPVSPHLAARRVGAEVDLTTAASWVRRSSPGAELLLAETAGALLSPLSRSTVNLDLVLALAPTALVLIAPDRLGVLHEVASARRILPADLVARLVVVLVAPELADASTGTNVAELAWLGTAPGGFSWPRGEGPADPVLDACLRFT